MSEQLLPPNRRIGNKNPFRNADGSTDWLPFVTFIFAAAAVIGLILGAVALSRTTYSIVTATANGAITADNVQYLAGTGARHDPFCRSARRHGWKNYYNHLNDGGCPYCDPQWRSCLGCWRCSDCRHLACYHWNWTVVLRCLFDVHCRYHEQWTRCLFINVLYSSSFPNDAM